MGANHSQSQRRLKSSNRARPALPSMEGVRFFGAIGGPNEIKKIAREVERLFQHQMEQVGKRLPEDWSEAEWDEYRKRRARIQQLRCELQRSARPS